MWRSTTCHFLDKAMPRAALESGRENDVMNVIKAALSGDMA